MAPCLYSVFVLAWWLAWWRLSRYTCICISLLTCIMKILQLDLYISTIRLEWLKPQVSYRVLGLWLWWVNLMKSHCTFEC